METLDTTRVTDQGEVNVVVPHIHLHPDLPRTLETQGIHATFIPTWGHDGYWQMLHAQWAKGDTFIVLEQDKIPDAGALQELWDCPSPWCHYPVPMRDNTEPSPYPSLACTKFSRELIARAPHLLEEVGLLDLGLGEKEWSRLDLAIAGLLEGHYGVRAHEHETGRILHYH